MQQKDFGIEEQTMEREGRINLPSHSKSINYKNFRKELIMKEKCENCGYYRLYEKLGKIPKDKIEHGTCRIRSVNSPIFPERHISSWCGEYVEKILTSS